MPSIGGLYTTWVGGASISTIYTISSISIYYQKKKKKTNKSPILLLFLQHVECCVQYTTTYIHPPHVYSHQFKLLDCVCYYCICSCLHCLSLTVRNFICRPIVDSVIHNRFVSRTLCCVHYYGCIVVFLFAMRDIAYVTHSWTRHTHTQHTLCSASKQ